MSSSVDPQARRLIGWTASAFAVLWLDVAIGHLSTEHWHPWMGLPLGFLPLAALATAFCAVRTSPRLSTWFRRACYCAIIVGLLGFSFHLARVARDLKGAIQWEVLARLMRYPPVFAPLAVSGVGILGLLVGDSQHKRGHGG